MGLMPKVVGIGLLLIACAIGLWVAVAFRRDAGQHVRMLKQSIGTGSAGDELVLSELKKAGSDLNKPTDIRFYLYIPALNDAQRAARTLREHGFKVEVRAPLGPLPDGSVERRYSVVANAQRVPSSNNTRMARNLFQGLALRYRGEYDGWEAAIAK
jgi:rhodanese-related sulfurtransferase